MNKKLLTVAIGAALAVPMLAQADATVYGKAHVSWDYQTNDTSTANAQDTFSYVSDNSTRIGVKASEDLGGGTKALFQVEISTPTDTAAAMTVNRNSYLGLGGVFGTIMLGKYDSPFKEVGRIADPFNDRVGDARNVIGNGGTANTWDRRVANMVRYASPTFGGVTIVAQYSGSDSAAAGTGEQGSASVMWKAGGATVGAAYDVQSTAAGTEGFETGYRFAGTFNFGMFTVGGLYEQLADVGGTSGNDRSAYGMSASVTLAQKNVIKAQYYVADSFDPAPDTGGSLWAVGYDYKFSKTTTGYVAYAQASNDANVNTYIPSSSNGGHGQAVTGVTNGGSPNALSVGLEMVF
jgi:predicted porin